MSYNLWDIIVVGGGLAGSVITSRLWQADNSLRILLIEAGQDLSNNTIIPYAANQALLLNSPWDWNYTTVAQPSLDGRLIENPSGLGLGGGTIINSCGWIRGDHSDFDLWASTVSDDRWSYDGQLPYFRKMEHTFDPSINPDQHGIDGPMWFASVSSTGRDYPLRDTIKEGWAQNGVQEVPYGDANDGNPRGLGELEENRRDGLRELSSSAYHLNTTGATVLTNTYVNRILLSNESGFTVATGVELANGTTLYAKHEIILSAGTYRTPQLLMLSGIGDKRELEAFGIDAVVDSPDVGKHLHDHLELVTYWELTEAAQAAGVAIGSDNPLFTEPQFGLGIPADWVVTETVPTDGLVAAITADEGQAPNSSHPLLSSTRSFMETIIIYAAGSAADPVVALNGSHITVTLVGLLPTSEGNVTLQSTDPSEQLNIDPNYVSTNVDKYVWRQGLKRVAQLMGTPAMKNIVVGETPPDGFSPLTTSTSDSDLDARTAHSAYSTYHYIGTASMGKVVDTDFKVKSVSGLRVVDASVIPVVITAHLQQAVYAMSEQAAVIIAKDL